MRSRLLPSSSLVRAVIEGFGGLLDFGQTARAERIHRHLRPESVETRLRQRFEHAGALMRGAMDRLDHEKNGTHPR